MKSRMLALTAVLLAATLVTAHAASWWSFDSKAKDKPAKNQRVPGVEMAQTLSMITGVAISPLLGVGAVGAWQYYEADTPEQKAKLHWYANPYFWVPALVLVALCFIKDTAGTALPTALKKPLDVADTIENKISGLVATGAFVPLAVQLFQQSAPAPADGALLSAMGFAAIDLSWLYNILIIPLAMFVFFIVFLASNAINILILLSPFTTIDAALKGFRLALLASVAGTAWIDPWLGAAWALVIVVIAYFIAGWSFRLSHFGLVFIWDFVTARCKRFAPHPAENTLFLARKVAKAPARTYGRLTRDANGELQLTYRPWLVLPERTVVLPNGNYLVGCGLLYSEVVRVEGDTAKTMLLLPPRYISHEKEFSRVYGLGGIRDVGLRAAWTWLKGTFRGRPAAALPA